MTLTFNYSNGNQVIAGIKIVMTESDGTITILTTDANGQVTLPTTSNTYTLSASFTETGDDPISLIDAIQILQYGGELRDLTEDQKTAADVNQDGEVDVLDAIWILQHLGELRTLDGGLIFLDANTGKPLSETTFNPGDTPSISVIRLGDVDGDFDPSLITDHAPILTGKTTLTVDENEVDISTLVASDADGDTLTYSITGGADQDLFTINESTGVLSFITGPDYEDPSDAGFDNLYDVEISVSDGSNTTIQALVVSVLDLNDRGPVILNLASSISVDENQTSVVTVSASDADGDSLTYSLSGTDASSFSINSSSGVITFNSAPDYETKSSYSITISVSDGITITTQALAINVVNVNEAPAISNLASSVSVAENQTSVVTVSASDVDGNTLTYSLSGTDASLFSISDTGVLSFKTGPNYENPGDSGGDNVYDLVINVSDGINITTQALAINVVNVNEAPAISNLASSVSVAENQTSVVTVSASDVDGNTLTYSLSGTDASLFSISDTGVLSFKTGPNYENPGDSGGDNVYDLVINVSDGINITTQALVVSVTNENEVVSGKAIDGYVAGATVFQDLNNNNILDSGIDILSGGAGNDTLNGKSGDDILDGGVGRDNLTGGTGTDTFIIRENDGSTTLNEANVVTDFSNGTDIIGLDGLTFSELTIEQGVNGIDILSGGAGNDTLNGNSGDDILDGGSGKDTMSGGSGSDTFVIRAGDGNTTLADADVVTDFSNGTDIIGILGDQLSGGAGNDTLNGNSGDDILDGGSGKDTMSGGSGSDTFVIRAGDGNTTLADADVVTDFSTTSAGTDVIGLDGLTFSELTIEQGVNGIDILSGGAGNDTLNGNSGDDILDGGSGKDTMSGGSGSDTFVIRAGDGNTTLADADVVTDFSNGTDIIGLDGLTFSELTIEQGTEDYANHTLISITATGEYLLILQNTTASNITETDFATASTTTPTVTGTAGDDTLVGTVDYGNHTLISITATGEYLLILQNTTASNITETDFATASTTTPTVTGTAGDDTLTSIAYDALTIEQGTGDYANHTLISITATGEYLLILQNTTASNITETDFATASTTTPTVTGTAGDDTLVGTWKYDLDTLISITATGEYLLILQNTTASNITETDFATASTTTPTVTGTAGDDTVTGNDIEPFTTTDALGNFTITLSSISNSAPVKIITGFDLATNEIHPSIMEISSTETGTYIITPISTLIGKLKADDANLTAAAAEQLVATALGISLSDSPNDTLLGYDPLSLMNGSNVTEATEAKPVYAANQLLMSLAGGSFRAVTYTVNDVLTTLTSTLQTIVNDNGGGTISLSVSDTITLGQKAYDALFNAYVDAMQTGVTPLSADFLTLLFQNQQSAMQTIIKELLDGNVISLNGTNYTYSDLLTTFNSVSNVNDYIDSLTVTYSSAIKNVLDSIFDYITTYVGDNDNGEAAAIGTALTQLNSGIKGLDLTQIFGTYINNDGTYPSGQDNASLITALNSKIATLVTLAADTLGDVLGIDTQNNFPGASVILLTSGDDTSNGTEDSNLIATLDGTDTVNGLGGNDKIIGGTGVDTFDGGDGNDHLYGYAGNDVLSGGAGDDKLLGGLGNDTLNGGAGDDELQGKAGDDVINPGTGSDNSYGGLGNDTFNITDKSGAFTDTIDGSSGTDTLDIDYSGVTSLGSFTSFSYDSSTETFTAVDSNGGTINWKNIENLTVGDYAYTRVTDNSDNAENAFWNSTEKVLYMFNGASVGSELWKTTDSDELSSLSINDDVTVQGSSGGDTMNLNVDRASDYTGNWTLNMKDGNDSFYSAKLKNGDSVDMGAGDDYIAFMVSGGSGTPTIANLDLTKLDGGAGSDTMSWGESTGVNGQELTLTTGGATNFENIYGTSATETIKGDANDNILKGGRGGADTIYGYAGNDTLYGHGQDSDNYNDSNYTDAKTLYGGAGNDTLYGGYGDDTLDGGTGIDTLTGGNGVDTFVIRTGDGSTTLADANVITDFSDGTDIISMDGVAYDDMTIEQGTGSYASHTLVKVTATGEYLLIIQNTTASDFTAADFSNASTEAQTFTGTSGNDTIIGGAGNDTFNGGAGSDTLYGHAGNDTFNITDKSGAFTDTIDGSSGTDTLDIDYSGVTSLGSFTSFSYDSSTETFTAVDSNGGTINWKNIENLTVGDYAYTRVTDNSDNAENAFWNSTEKVLYMFNGASVGSELWKTTDSDELSSLSINDDVTVQGSSGGDTMNLNVDRASDYTGNWTLNMKDGNDSFYSAKLKNGDSVDMGAGDDYIAFMVSGGSGTPTIANLDLTKLDGGAGSDTMSWGESTGVNGQELTLTTGGATNFENIYGTSATETIKGDANDNILKGGRGGADTIYGYAGNDTLYGHGQDSDNYNDSNYTDAKTLYGGAGNDTLYGGYGDDTLDGGTGIDTLTGGNGVDTFVIRTGDGSTTLADANVITDFSDGTDIISMDGVAYDDMTIEQGTGSYASHTLVKVTATGEYLLIIQNTTASDFTAADFSNASTEAQTFTGTSGNDTIIGGAGNDTFNGGAGSDTLYGHAGNDTFNITDKSGAFTDTIDGSSGTDTLDIDYSGVTSLGSFTSFSYDSSTETFTAVDSNGGTINWKNIENLTVGDYAYTRVTDNSDNAENAFWNSTEKVLYMFNGASVGSELWKTTDSDELSSLSINDDVTVQGSSGGDTMNLNVDRASDYTGNWTLNMKDGNDSFYSAKLKNGDSVDMGAGDDYIAFMVSGGSGTPTIANLDLTKLDGGAGSDTMSWGESTGVNGQELTLTTGGATNFENIYGTSATETIKGDANDNILKGGRGGADTIYGYAGNDTLYGHGQDSDNYNDSNYTDAKTLYGGAGNDTLYGGYGDDTLDGGTGIDTLTGGNGVDTFVLRSGDGSTTLANANVIKDFADGTDVLGMDNGLNFNELTIEQGTGDYANHTLVSITATGEYLAIIESTTASNITDVDFSAVDISNSGIAEDTENNPNNNDTNDNDIVDAPDNEDTPMDSDLPDLSFWTNDYDLSFITLPDTVVEAPIVLTDALLELIEIPIESIELIFPLNGDAIHMDKVVNSAVNEINLDPLLQNDWQAVLEEYIYTSELG